jgi:acyl phosphate:glycerol-3-phosphate acyltransferase
MTTNFLFSLLLGYLFGSIPSGYFLVKWKSNKDIRHAGSGNVGALNSYLVTRSRLVGAGVLLLDLLKGVAAVLVAAILIHGGLPGMALAGFGAVLGHNFSVWLKLGGGRGLATAAGVALILAWPVIPAWGIFWFVGFLVTGNVNAGNAIATVMMIVAGMVVPSSLLDHMVTGAIAPDAVRLFVVMIFGVILLKHIAPVREYVKQRRETTSGVRMEAEA